MPSKSETITKRPKGKNLLILLLLVCLSFDNSAQMSKDYTELSRQIDLLASNQQWVNEIPGFVIGVIVDNQVIFKKAYGVHDVRTNTPLTATSDFHMASVSKPFAAVAILQLVEAGRLHLDTALVHYLSYFKMNDDRYKKITLHHILTHTSGIPDVTDYEWEKAESREDAAERYVKTLADKHLDFAPGDRFNYSNAAYDVLADVVAKTTGASFEQYVRERIFVPADMTNSSFLLSDIAAQQRALPHVTDANLTWVVSRVYPYNRMHAPSSTLHSNLEDMLKWAQVFINNGQRQGHQILKQESLNTMLQPKYKVNEQFDVCQSWFKVAIGTKNIFFHSGGDLGYRTFIGFDPDTKTAVVLMGNNDIFDATEPAFAIFRTIYSDSVTTPKKPIAMHLKSFILNDGIKKVKEEYFVQNKTHADKYAFGAENVIPLASWLYDRGHKKQAVEVLVFCTELEPNVTQWYEHIADVYIAWGKNADAITWLKKGLSIDPDNSSLQQKLSSLPQGQ